MRIPLAVFLHINVLLGVSKSTSLRTSISICSAITIGRSQAWHLLLERVTLISPWRGPRVLPRPFLFCDPLEDHRGERRFFVVAFLLFLFFSEGASFGVWSPFLGWSGQVCFLVDWFMGFLLFFRCRKVRFGGPKES